MKAGEKQLVTVSLLELVKSILPHMPWNEVYRL